jgi:hypothetical protein
MSIINEAAPIHKEKERRGERSRSSTILVVVCAALKRRAVLQQKVSTTHDCSLEHGLPVP